MDQALEAYRDIITEMEKAIKACTKAGATILAYKLQNVKEAFSTFSEEEVYQLERVIAEYEFA